MGKFKMSLDKSIQSGKEHRNPRRATSPGCQVGGSCSSCRGNRMYQTTKAKIKADYKEDYERRM